MLAVSAAYYDSVGLLGIVFGSAFVECNECFARVVEAIGRLCVGHEEAGEVIDPKVNRRE